MPYVPSEWEKQLEEFSSQLEKVTFYKDGTLSPLPSSCMKIPAFTACRERWEKNNLFNSWGLEKECARDVYIFYRLDRKKMDALCKEGVLPVAPLQYGKILYGSDEEITEQVRGAYNITKLAALYPGLDQGIEHRVDKARLLKIISQHGAVREESDWRKILYSLDRDIIDAMIEKGSSIRTIYKEMNDASYRRDMALFEKLSDIMISRCGFVKADNETLIVTKYLPEMDGVTTLRTVFNFSTRRVQEIHDRKAEKEIHSTMQSSPFSEFDSDIIEAMREKLIELKGNPPELSPRITKSLRGIGRPE